MPTARPLMMNMANTNLQQRFNDPEITTQNVGAKLARQNQVARQEFYDTLREQRQGNNMTMQRQGYGGATGDPRPGEGAQRRRAQGRQVPPPSVRGSDTSPTADAEIGRRLFRTPVTQTGRAPVRVPETWEFGGAPPQIAEQGPTPSYASQAPMGSAMPSLAAQAQNPFAAAMTEVGLLNQTNTGFPQRMQGNTIRPDFTYGLNAASPMWQGPFDRANDPFNYYWDSPIQGRGNVLPQFQGMPGFANQGIARQWPGSQMTPEVMSGLMQQYGNPMAAKGQISPMALKQQHGVMPFASSGWPSPEMFTQQGLQQPMPTPFGVPYMR